MKTYDPSKLSVIVGGFIISGFAEDSLVTVGRREDTFTLTMGADGEGTRSKTNDKSGDVKITLMQTSASNAILTAYAKADELQNAGVFSLLIKDDSGSSIYSAEQAWVVKPPEAEFGKAATTREWSIQTDNLDWNEGGN